MGRMFAVPTTALLLLALLAATTSAQHATNNVLHAGRRTSSLSRHYHSQSVPFTNNDRSAACVTTRCHVGRSRWKSHRGLFGLRGGSDDVGSVSPDTSAGEILPSPSADIILPTMETLQTAMVSGANVRGVGALAAVATLTILPLTAFIKQSYAFVVGCGVSLITMSLAIMSAFGLWPPTKGFSGNKCKPAYLLICACLIHGFRMASMAILRDVTSGADPTLSEKDDGTSICPMTWLKRIPLAINVSVLYAVMISPVLYALRGAVNASPTQKKSPLIAWIGIALTCTGLALAAITDIYKYVVEPRNSKADDFNDAAETVLNGGVANLPGEGNAVNFQLARYLNIFGEGLFWIGLYLGGISSFGNDAIAWLCGTLTVLGVVGFMFVPFLLHQLLSRIKYDHEEQ